MNMIEKVARAIDSTRTFGRPVPTDREMAKAAIEAMKEPTEEMKKAEDATGEVHWNYNCHICGGAKHAWECMIDTALKE